MTHHRRSGQRGTRRFEGRYYMLAGRGTRERMEQEARSLRERWKYVRIVPANRDARLLDDWMIYVFERR